MAITDLTILFWKAKIKNAIEIDGEIFHDKRETTDEKFYDELMRQNSLIYQNRKLYRWTDKQLVKSPDRVKDELTLFLEKSYSYKPVLLYAMLESNPFKKFEDMGFMKRSNCKLN